MVAILGAGVVLVAGCGQLPTPDKVRTVRHVAADAPDIGAPEVRKLPAGPLPGEQPADVVRGFIAAAADPSARHALSRSFLARGAKWDDAASLVVYDPSSVTTTVSKAAPDRAVVTLRLATELVADRDGGYRPSLTTITRRYDVIRSDGQWRLAGVPAGVLVTWRDVARTYRAVRLYAISATGDMLVPDPVLLDTDRPALPTTAVRAQLRAPTDWLSSAAGTAVPPDASLLGSATLVDQQVTADLSLPSMPTSPTSRLALIAQLRAMLGGLPGVKRVRLLIDGIEAAVPPGDAPANPDSTPPDGPAVAVVAGRLVPVGPAHQGGGTDVSTPAAEVGNSVLGVSAGSAGNLAAVTSSGTLLFRVGRSSSMRVAPGSWRSASWVRSLGVLGVERSDGALAFLPRHGGATSVDDGGLGKSGPISSLAVSRDGARVAAIVGPPGARRVYVGHLAFTPPFPADTAPGQQPTVVGAVGWTPVTAVGDDIRAVDWSSSLGLVVIVSGAGEATSVRQIPLDGPAVATTLNPRGLPAPAEAIAAAPGEPVLVASGGRIWRYDESGAGRWLAIGAGNLPAYPS